LRALALETPLITELAEHDFQNAEREHHDQIFTEIGGDMAEEASACERERQAGLDAALKITKRSPRVALSLKDLRI